VPAVGNHGRVVARSGACLRVRDGGNDAPVVPAAAQHDARPTSAPLLRRLTRRRAA
jgi:hypothetical protein